MNPLDPRAAIVAATLVATGAPASPTHPPHHAHRARHARASARHAHAPRHRRPSAARPHRVRAASGRDPAVSILDFRFAPPTTTVHVGDTVTWTNTGTQPHTATATGHSFNTGVLSHGQSASHTFTEAGTFTYFCQVHPFMHGTIVVLAAAPAATPTSPSPPGQRAAAGQGAAAGRGTPGSSNAAAPAAAGPRLPFTGMNVGLACAIGALLVGAGVLVRVVARQTPREQE